MATAIEGLVGANRPALERAFRATAPFGTGWLLGRMAPVLARITLEVVARGLAPQAIPFLSAFLASEHLLDPYTARWARHVLACLKERDLHPATLAVRGDIDPDALDDPGVPVFAASLSPPSHQEPAS